MSQGKQEAPDCPVGMFHPVRHKRRRPWLSADEAKEAVRGRGKDSVGRQGTRRAAGAKGQLGFPNAAPNWLQRSFPTTIGAARTKQAALAKAAFTDSAKLRF